MDIQVYQEKKDYRGYQAKWDAQVSHYLMSQFSNIFSAVSGSPGLLGAKGKSGLPGRPGMKGFPGESGI